MIYLYKDNTIFEVIVHKNERFNKKIKQLNFLDKNGIATLKSVRL